MSYKDSELYKDHERIGFPKIEESMQFDILVNHKFEHIINLTPDGKDKAFPHGLLLEYITITKAQLKQHLRDIDYIQQQLDSFSKTFDGYWLQQTESGYICFECERGTDYDIIELKSDEEVLDLYTERLGWCCKTDT